MYNVVFQYNQEAGGYAGTRFCIGYKDQADFESSADNSRMIVLAQGVSDEKALEIASLTPEVCHITAAIQEASHKADGSVDLKSLNHHLFMAGYAIHHDREFKRETGLRSPENYVRYQPGPEKTEKNTLIKIVQDLCYDPHGDINLDQVNRFIQLGVLEILSNRLTSYSNQLWDDVDSMPLE